MAVCKLTRSQVTTFESRAPYSRTKSKNGQTPLGMAGFEPLSHKCCSCYYA